MSIPRGLLPYFKNEIFVETGTYMGNTVQEAIDIGFKKIYSIELHEGRFQECCERFSEDDRVTIYFGDSIDILPKIIEQLDRRATFWLDAHVTKGFFGKKRCPILKELDIIDSHFMKNHTILIDDMRLMTTLRFGRISRKTLKDKLLSINDRYTITYEDGVGRYGKTLPNDILIAKVKE